MKKNLFLILFLIAQTAFTEEYAEVYFTDKEDMTRAFANPINMLGEEATARENSDVIPDFQTALNTVLSASQKKILDVSIYPNPVTSYFELVFSPSIGDIKVEIFNILGKKVLSRGVTPKNRTVNVAKLDKGIYMVRVSSGKASKIFKIVKQ